jgi:uncharacterized protein YdeI (YjbR/CyaY-like superfamily)
MPEATESTSATPPATVTIPAEQYQKMLQALEASKAITEMKAGSEKIQAYAMARAAESEARLKRIEAEVMQRGAQLARVEKHLSAWLIAQGVKYE